ncbi:hypothetical protein NL676_038000 [Syzygium grande]|nr:hypothetical protein NL676_038000 [Syzygium grande]
MYLRRTASRTFPTAMKVFGLTEQPKSAIWNAVGAGENRFTSNFSMIASSMVALATSVAALYEPCVRIIPQTDTDTF